jgi:hypothetical protein
MGTVRTKSMLTHIAFPVRRLAVDSRDPDGNNVEFSVEQDLG